MATEADFKRIGNYARLHNKDQNIDRRKSKRVVPLEVLCMGYSRTGTLTMHKAMGILGYPNPYHFSSILDNVTDSDLWMEAIDAKYNGKGQMPDKAFFDGLLGHVGSISDSPANLFTEQYLVYYPDAKVVLVERDIDSWYKSWMAYCENAYAPALHFLGNIDPFWLGRVTTLGGAITRIQSGHAVNKEQARVRSRDAYRHHYRDVKELTPPERLLVFQLKDGWEPLCKFLGKPVPDVPFPHENEAERNAQAFKEIGMRGLKNIATYVVIAATIVAVPTLAFRYRLQH